jgi:phosphatidylglycerol:prolipoprotein diacylglycerol transferase
LPPTFWGIAVHPILLDAGPVTIYSYGVLLAAAYLLGLWLGVKRANAAGLDGNKVLDLGIWVIIAALVGAKGLLFIVDFEHFTSSREEFLSLLRSGGVFYGGLIAASLTCIYQLRKHKLPLWQSGDLFAPGIALGYMVGRLGCFMAGCCYGKPTQVAWAVTFTDPAAAMNVGTPLGVPLHPTQLYESLAGLVILGILLITEKRGAAYPGRTFWRFVFLYGVSRFVIEYFRGDDRGMAGMFSTSQLISMVLVPLSVVMLWWLRGGQRPSQPATPVVRRRPQSASA